MESAMISRLGNEKRMPSWFMASPSHTAMAGNSLGVPPAARTPAFPASAMVFRWMCRGTTSLAELTAPTSGLDNSSRVRRRAYSSERCGAFSSPCVIFLLLMLSSVRADVKARAAGRKERHPPESYRKPCGNALNGSALHGYPAAYNAHDRRHGHQHGHLLHRQKRQLHTYRRKHEHVAYLHPCDP